MALKRSQEQEGKMALEKILMTMNWKYQDVDILASILVLADIDRWNFICDGYQLILSLNFNVEWKSQK